MQRLQSVPPVGPTPAGRYQAATQRAREHWQEGRSFGESRNGVPPAVRSLWRWPRLCVQG